MIKCLSCRAFRYVVTNQLFVPIFDHQISRYFIETKNNRKNILYFNEIPIITEVQVRYRKRLLNEFLIKSTYYSTEWY